MVEVKSEITRGHVGLKKKDPQKAPPMEVGAKLALGTGEKRFDM